MSVQRAERETQAFHTTVFVTVVTVSTDVTIATAAAAAAAETMAVHKCNAKQHNNYQ